MPLRVKGCSLTIAEKGGAPRARVKVEGQAEYYVRRDATTFAARPEDIRGSVLCSASLSVQTSRWG